MLYSFKDNFYLLSSESKHFTETDSLEKKDRLIHRIYLLNQIESIMMKVSINL